MSQEDSNAVIQTLKTNQPIEIFYSYSHKDEGFRDEMEKHLTLLKRRGFITGWHDRRIDAGTEWKNQLDSHLESAGIILLLISPDFLASDYCYDIEMTRAMERHEKGEARVIPIILRSCDWSSALFAKLQALPKNAKPIKSWADTDEAFTDVVSGIKRAITGLDASSPIIGIEHRFGGFNEEANIIPKTFLKRSLRLMQNQTTIFTLICLFCSVLLIGGRFSGLDFLFFATKKFPIPSEPGKLPILREASWVQSFENQQPCISRAKELARPYAILNVIQWLQYEDEPNGKLRKVNERIFYTVLPLKNIKETEQVFLEEYSGSQVVSHWFSPFREMFIGGGNKYQVAFNGEPGVPITITTGAEFSYNLPLKMGRSAFREKVTVNSDRDFWYYQNIDDSICQLTQILESQTLQLLPVGRGGVRVGKDGKLIEGDVLFQATSTKQMTNSSISMSWKDILPGDDMGVVFTWKPKEVKSN